MLCTFTTKDGKTLIVRSDDIRVIEDAGDDESLLIWMIGDQVQDKFIQGTARENAERIQQEELDLIARIEEHRQQLQRRMAEGYPAVPVKRGRP
jgi:hypothetical protein